MTLIPLKIVESAAKALARRGAPYRHYGRSEDVGFDCLGFVLAVARAVGAAHSAGPWPYGKMPACEILTGALLRYCRPCAAMPPPPGAIAVFSNGIRGAAAHMGVIVRPDGDDDAAGGEKWAVAHACERNGRTLIEGRCAAWRRVLLGGYFMLAAEGAGRGAAP